MAHLVAGRRLAASAAAAVVAGVSVLAVGATQARATALGPWQQVSATGLSGITEVGLARTADGTLHVAWSSQQPDNSESVEVAPISAGGSVGSAQTVVSGWESTDNPALGLTPSGGLQAFFGGIHTLAASDRNADENLATSTDGGNVWSLHAGDVVAPPASAYASQAAVSNAFAGQSTPLETWTGTTGVWVHAGTAPSTPDSNFQTALGSCCGYYANLASDASGDTELAWYSNATAQGGVWAQAVSASGAPAGSPQQMPDTADLDVGELQRTPIVARPQGGFYVAYPYGDPSFKGVELWKVGGDAIKLAGVHSPSVASAAVDQAGRVWVFWAANVGVQPELFATRSNPSVTRFGAIVSVGSPSGTGDVFSIDGNAEGAALDVLSTLSNGSTNATIWTRHVYPGLTVTLTPSTVKLHHSTKVTLSVTDAGTAVKGAAVRLGGHTAKTGAAGKAIFKVDLGVSVSAGASAPGYVNGVAELLAKR